MYVSIEKRPKTAQKAFNISQRRTWSHTNPVTCKVEREYNRKRLGKIEA